MIKEHLIDLRRHSPVPRTIKATRVFLPLRRKMPWARVEIPPRRLQWYQLVMGISPRHLRTARQHRSMFWTTLSF